MRNWIIGAAAMLAAAVPGVAAAGTGYVDLGYTNSNLEVFGTDVDVDTWAVGGAVAIDAPHAIGVQLDGRFGSAEPDFSSNEIDFWNIGGHAYKRSTNWLFGLYLGVGNIDAGGGTDVDEWTVALEGQYYMAQTTIDGAISRSEIDDADLETTALDLGVRHFLNDNFSLSGNVGFANLESSGGDVDANQFGVGGEYQFSGMPVSVFAGYTHSEIDDINLEVDSLSIGVRYNWGGTLFDRNRSGAGLSRRGGAFSRLFGDAV
jgi:hypothetical protein